ncbi:ADP-ribosylglycohydrolase family protein [Levilactobacillus parabrevis]|uniref:ADP-ribosylglycohydrolase n=1 Tax=Levilactobacillus parabrevis ATCC 53295 TaxID=1267003 RepID=A0A0R1GRW4_9LACO|nr:ADP-ribosylglycohydrolase family protein [Levilactobacillus parabrevis]KRK36774.1 ADP-ribosylglycohydrolase [Levilactobacillus parabrevis ATCC 53295]KRO05981.1 ADP-ribosylglycohydrolase [Levilactobacillus parabrevis]
MDDRSQAHVADCVRGVLYGQAVGDAMGMPTELWSVSRIHQRYPGGVTDFMAGPRENDIAMNYLRGQYTDDTSQALLILDSLQANQWSVQSQDLVRRLLVWAQSVHAFERNILGPSSKAALLAIQAGQDPQAITQKAVTNGCAMRIAPVGALFKPQQLSELVAMVVAVTRVTHATDVAFSGAAMVAGAVTAALADYGWSALLDWALLAGDTAGKLGTPTWEASPQERLRLGLKIARETRDDPAEFTRQLAALVGTGTAVSESVPAALTLAYYGRDMRRCALLAANLGGDTDTIGAMAVAICGAKQGYQQLPAGWGPLIDQQNPQHHLADYVTAIMDFRQQTNT